MAAASCGSTRPGLSGLDVDHHLPCSESQLPRDRHSAALDVNLRSSGKDRNDVSSSRLCICWPATGTGTRRRFGKSSPGCFNCDDADDGAANTHHLGWTRCRRDLTNFVVFLSFFSVPLVCLRNTQARQDHLSCLCWLDPS